MKTTILRRVIAACLCLCMLPAMAMAYNGDDTPVTRSDFSFRLYLNADAFPNDGLAHYEDWEAFLDRISIRGSSDAQHPFRFLNRVTMDASLYLDEESKIPFFYDSYMTYRYLRSPALRGEFLHFHMDNFFQFMLKGYYFMGLPTQLIALPMYPEAGIDLYERYMDILSRTLAGEGSRVIDYDMLYEMCQELSAFAQADEMERLYYFLTCLLFDVGLSDMVLDRLCYSEDWLDYLDPESAGLTITADGGTETWTLGETTVFVKTEDGFTLTLPDYEGYEFVVSLSRSEMQFRAQIHLDGAEYLGLLIEADSLPGADALEAEGRVTFTVSGDALYEETAPVTLAYDFTRASVSLPSSSRLNVAWVHPETDQPAVGFVYEADHTGVSPDVFEEKIYPLRQDFFTLNDSFLAEYKERFLPTIALGAAPILLETPAGVISDIIAFMDETGLLAFLGIE